MGQRRWGWRLLGVVLLGCALGAAVPGQPAPGRIATQAAGAAQSAHPADTLETPQQVMAKRAGEYTRGIQFLNAAGTQGTPFSGTSKISVILDGHFLMEENDDVVFGKPVHGIRIYGFNTATGKYELASLFSQSNAILLFAGTSGDGGKTVDYSGESTTAKGEKLNLRAHFRQVDNDQFVVTVASVAADGKEAPFQETTYKRTK